MSGPVTGASTERETFVWGVSTSAYQIEGAYADDGKGPSIWDEFTSRPGRVADGSDGRVATDHLRRSGEDVRLIADLGVDAYRFSVSWPRVMPSGRGRLEQRGVDFYLRLIDALLEVGVEPWVCLYHWDLPLALQERGGWAKRDTALYYADYAERIAHALGSGVKRYFTMNEPNVHALLGHVAGVHAPGVRDLMAGLAAVHHLNLATGFGVERVRSVAPRVPVGTILNLQGFSPAREGEEHEAAAAFADVAFNRAFLDPLFRASYPEPVGGLLEAFVESGDLDVCRAPIDMLGVNHYTRLWVLADASAPAGVELVAPPPGSRTTAMGWEVAPEGLVGMLLRLKEEYGNPPVYVTENGAAYADSQRSSDGTVDDLARVRYLRSYLAAAAEAWRAGCDLRGYFVWTLVDNFEWADGFSRRFGLVELVPGTLERRPKRSYRDFQSIVRSGAWPVAPSELDG